MLQKWICFNIGLHVQKELMCSKIRRKVLKLGKSVNAIPKGLANVNAEISRARTSSGPKYVSAPPFFLSLVLKMAAGVSKMERWPVMTVSELLWLYPL